MHVIMFADQHVESLGGAQVSMRLQRRYLERAGHRVTVVAPRRFRPVAADAAAGVIALPAVPITPDREYSLSWPGRRADRVVDDAVRGIPAPDVVHVQADFWGAYLGHRFAARHGIPAVHTMHNRVDVGLAAVVPFPRTAMRALDSWAAHAVGGPRGEDGWSYLQRFALRSRAVTAPSAHFARRLEEHAVAPQSRGVDVVWNGIDDEALAAALRTRPTRSRPARPRLLWIGRMSPEKRVLAFLEALAESDVDAEVEVIGAGGQLRAARRMVARRRPRARVRFSGALAYPRTLERIAAADAVVQTSVGFETQGMTVFEAAAMGVPALVADPDIADELGAGTWRPADGSVGALAAALRAATADIRAGDGPRPDPTVAERFRQSSRTQAMLDVYRSVLDEP